MPELRMPPADFKDHFSGVASAYAEFRPTYPHALFDWLASLPEARALAWDCACGSGQAALGLARQFTRIIATDASAAQIAAALPHPAVEYRVAPAEQSGLPDASVDLVCVAQALHWLDLERFYAEARRVLRPGGVLAVWCYGVHRLDDPDADRLMRHFYGTVVGPYWPPERTLVENGYRMLPFPFAEIAAPAYTLQAEWTLDQLLGYLRSWSASDRYRKARGVDAVDAFATEMLPLWGAPERLRTIRWPLALRVGRVA